MKREVSQEQLQIAAELEEIAQKIRQGKWEMASFNSAEAGIDPVQCFASVIQGSTFFCEEEDPQETMRENLEFLGDFPMYVFFLNKRADPTTSRTSISRWKARKPEDDRVKQMSPSKSRLAQALGADANETGMFMRRVFSLLPKGTPLGKITKTVQSLVQEGERPTPERVAAVMKDKKENTLPQQVEKEEPIRAEKRKHVSVWEIRN